MIHLSLVYFCCYDDQIHCHHTCKKVSSNICDKSENSRQANKMVKCVNTTNVMFYQHWNKAYLLDLPHRHLWKNFFMWQAIICLNHFCLHEFLTKPCVNLYLLISISIFEFTTSTYFSLVPLFLYCVPLPAMSLS